MFFLIQGIQLLFRPVLSSETAKQIKPFTLHLSLLLLVFIYAFCGGLIFNRLEADAVQEHQRKESSLKSRCVFEAIHSHSRSASAYDIFTKGVNFLLFNTTQEGLTTEVLNCFKTELDARSQWSYVTATLYGFGIVTTLGYNRISPITLAGRLFCVVYGLCGIPITMIIIANIGQYLNQFAGASRKYIETYRREKRRKSFGLNEEDIPDSSIEVMSLGLVIAFLLYVCFGAMLLPLLNGEFDFLNGIYFNFLCLTAIDFGQLVPARFAFLPITFLYVVMGLAITTIAIDVGSEYMKKLHHLGKKMKDVAHTKIWFGGKTLKVKELLHAVGKKCGIDPVVIDNMNLDNIVERAVAINEGREPPPDLTEEFSTTERSPSIVVQQPLFEKTSDKSPSTLGNCSPLDARNFVAINVDPEMEEGQQEVDWEVPLVVADKPEAWSVNTLEEIDPTQVVYNQPQVLEDTRTEGDDEPRRFKEKKQKYARDPKRLHDTYKEEWKRLEKLSTRLGPRRTSVLTEKAKRDSLSTVKEVTPIASGSTSTSNISMPQESPDRHSFAADSNDLEQQMTTTSREPSRTPSPGRQSSEKQLPSSRQLLSPSPAKEDLAGAKSRRSSSSASIKKLSPDTYKKFGEMVKVKHEE